MDFLALLKKYWAILSYLGICVLLFLTNYHTGTYLTGWDNLHPEFNFGANIGRSFFAVWQEYQGLGLLGGMGHASDLVHQLVLLMFSLVFPLHMLRYIWYFLMLFIGATGAYMLIRSLAFKAHDEPVFAFLGGLFYLLNLATIQQFYAPFEAFIAHFGFLPWLLLVAVRFVQENSKKNLLTLVIVTLIATPAAYIPTLFVVYMMALTLMLLSLFCLKPSLAFVKRSVALFGIIVVVNAFWLLPFTYFTLTESSVTLNAKINQMATETVYEQNQEFGSITNVMLLKGFWFQNVDPNLKGDYQFMLAPWRNYLQNPFITILGYGLFGVILLGIITSVRRKKPLSIAFFSVFILGVTMLASTTPPFSWINVLFRSHIPILNEAFRFPFTKFSNLTSLAFAFFFALGASWITQFIKQQEKYPLKKIALTTGIVGTLILIVFAFPAFRGALLYEKETIVIPQEYFQLFSFFKQQDPNTRIADFPQYTFWGWNFYRWGYGGSGFLWYGIKQPIIDRAFDVWSASDENYYWEISQAIYSKDAGALTNVLNKYQITWLVLDKNIINPSSPKTLFYPEFQELLSHIPSVHAEKQFGDITVYKFDLKDKPTAFTFLTDKLPSTNTYTWDTDDKAYKALGNYTTTATNQNVDYPFRSLSSTRSSADIGYSLTKDAKDLIFKSTLPKNDQAVTVTIPAYPETEKIVPAIFSSERTPTGDLAIDIHISTPIVSVGTRTISGGSIDKVLFTVKADDKATTSAHMSINSNGVASLPVPHNPGIIGTTFLTLTQDNVIVLNNDANQTATTTLIPATYLQTLPFMKKVTLTIPAQNGQLPVSVHYPLISDNYLSFTPVLTTAETISNCDGFRSGDVTRSSINATGINLVATDATACTAFYTATLPHEESYVTFLSTANTTERGMHFWIQNNDQESAPIDTFLPSVKKPTTEAFIIPPMEAFGSAYSFHFETISLGNNPTANTLISLKAYQMPYTFLKSIVTTQTGFHTDTTPSGHLMTRHPNESSYTISLPQGTKNGTLVLSQTYDQGWVAYTSDKPFSSLRELLPFIFGKKLTSHVKVNNWENGWNIDTRTKPYLVLVYIPQYLEYGGLFLLCSLLAVFLLVYKRTK